jgi:hypothetical protein
MRSLIRNKKAQEAEGPPGDWWVFVIIFSLVLPILVLLFFSILNTDSTYKTRAPYEIEEYILTQKFFSSDECFAYYDQVSGEFVQLTIDKGKFTKESLDECFPATENYYAARLTLKSKKDETELTTINWDSQLGADRTLAPKSITLYDQEKKEIASLIIELQDAKT